MIKKCPECKSTMAYSRWTGEWHCENQNCTVTIEEDGGIYHRPYAPADIKNYFNNKRKSEVVRQ